MFVCGGGAFNGALMAKLHGVLDASVDSTATLGLDPNWVEACAFAWLAKQRINNKPGNIPSATNAIRKGILGGVYSNNN